MLLKSLRWIFGYVSFEAIGESPEKLINLSVKNSIGLWDLKKVNKNLYGKMMLPEFENFQDISRKYGFNVSATKEYGLPTVKLRYSKRWGAVIGAAIFGLMLWLSSMYIWKINVSGNCEIPTESIITAAKKCTIYPGSFKNKIDSSLAEHKIMSEFGNIAWMSINIEGSCVNIVIKEKINSPQTIGESEPCNIVAARDGQIERLETYKGTPVVKSGDVVTQGTLLVSGVVEAADFKSNLVQSDCKAFAKTKHKIEKRIPLTTVQAKDTGKIVKKYKIRIFDKEIPIWPSEKVDDTYRCENFSDNIKFFGFEIPLSIFCQKYYEQECAEKNITPEEAKEKIIEELNKNQFKTSEDIQVLEKIEEETQENGEYIYKATFICMENIAKREKIERE